MPDAITLPQETDPRTEAAAPVSAEPRLSPKVRRLLRERSLHPADVVGSGSRGRITPTDVETMRVATRDAPRGSSPTGSPPLVRRAAAASSARTRASTAGRSETVALSRVRRTIAARMHRSLQTTAQLTSVVEVDMTRLMASRSRAKEVVRSREGVSLTPLALTARAVCEVLARHPVINAEIDTDAGTATYHRDVHLSVAVDTDAGLVAPTIRDAQVLTVPALARRIADLAERSRRRDLSPDDLAGGTFTITNTGSRGVLLDTPILNPPQAAILGTTLIEKRPVIVTDEFGSDTLASRQMSYLCLTYDHRLIDGADAARFLGDLKDTIETRELLPEFAG
jgi:pyruvate dehydrogenase E2 component (dihydrolipoamide acetyltransferase)